MRAHEGVGNRNSRGIQLDEDMDTNYVLYLFLSVSNRINWTHHFRCMTVSAT